MQARTPADVDRLFSEHMNAGRLDALVDLYEPTATLVGLDGSVATGHEAIRRELGATIAGGVQITMHVSRVVESGDGVAMVHNEWSATMAPSPGERVALAGKAIEVVRRQPDGTWRFVIDDPNARG